MHSKRARREDSCRRSKNHWYPCYVWFGPKFVSAKIALDITAKHSPNFFGELDEESYKLKLWNHKPLTDFWHIGAGIQKRLAAMNIHTMGQLAMAPTEPLYKEFGVDAEILIDHAGALSQQPLQILRPISLKAIQFQQHRSLITTEIQKVHVLSLKRWLKR